MAMSLTTWGKQVALGAHEISRQRKAERGGEEMGSWGKGMGALIWWFGYINP
jgi:hypothetical protein